MVQHFDFYGIFIPSDCCAVCSHEPSVTHSTLIKTLQDCPYRKGLLPFDAIKHLEFKGLAHAHHSCLQKH